MVTSRFSRLSGSAGRDHAGDGRAYRKLCALFARDDAAAARGLLRNQRRAQPGMLQLRGEDLGLRGSHLLRRLFAGAGLIQTLQPGHHLPAAHRVALFHIDRQDLSRNAGMHLVGVPGLDDEVGIQALAHDGHKEKGE